MTDPDIAVFVLKRDVKLQPTNEVMHRFRRTAAFSSAFPSGWAPVPRRHRSMDNRSTHSNMFPEGTDSFKATNAKSQHIFDKIAAGVRFRRQLRQTLIDFKSSLNCRMIVCRTSSGQATQVPGIERVAYKHSLEFRVRRYAVIATKPMHRLQIDPIVNN